MHTHIYVIYAYKMIYIKDYSIYLESLKD